MIMWVRTRRWCRWAVWGIARLNRYGLLSDRAAMAVTGVIVKAGTQVKFAPSGKWHGLKHRGQGR